MTQTASKPQTILTSFFAGREEARAAFLNDHGWSNAQGEVIAEDWASRRFWRYKKENQSRILMESLPDDHKSVTPGHKISDTLQIGRYLSDLGIHVPDIEVADAKAGYILMEDLGDQCLMHAVDNGADELELYSEAARVLREIQDKTQNNDLNLPLYKDSRIDIAKRRLMDWYLPLVRGDYVDVAIGDAFLDLWGEVIADFPQCQRSFVHIDFHAQNLMWMPEEKGMARIGVLDFQGAHFGPSAYDLTNLLDDIRRDVPQDIRDACYERFCNTMSAEERELFDLWYKVLSLQFRCRLAGQVIKIFKEKDDARYLDYLPRIQASVKDKLQDEMFSDIRDFCEDEGLFFDEPPIITLDRVEMYVPPEAF